jgi:hypothetical protein
MQLSPLPSIPSSQPVAPYAPQGQGGASTPQSHDSGGEFAQLLSSPKQPAPQSGQQQKRSDLPASASEEAAAAYYSGWMSALYPQPTPVVDSSLQGPLTAKPVGKAGPSMFPTPHMELPPGSEGGSGTKATTGAPYSSVKLPGAGEAPVAQPAIISPPVAQALPFVELARGSVGKTPVNPAVKQPAAALPAPQNPSPASPVPQAAVANTAGATIEPLAANLGNSAAVFSGAEKIAAPGPRNDGTTGSVSKGPDKKILSPDVKQLTNHDSTLGTSVAKVGPAMPTASQTERQPSATLAAAPVSGAAATPDRASAGSQAATPQMGVAQRAVEAALSSAEIFNSGGHKAVNLQFSMGNTDLSLTVQLRNGEIHTTFSTDSADLRSDLAHAWQSANPTSGGSLRLAEPVFTSPGATDGGSSFQQRGGQSQSEPAQTAAGNSGSNASTASTPDAADSLAQSPVSLATSLHLQAFA